MTVERKPYLNDGFYVEMPIVFQVLFSPVEMMVLNTVIHLSDMQHRFISQSLIVAYTGRDDKSVRAALRFLEQLGVIQKEKTCRRGTHYEIKNARLTQIIRTLNNVRNPVERMRLADRIRGKGNALHTTTIKNLTDTSLDSRI